ncbi:MAG TPA: RICIN domain-containing protein, partial [Candidatus Latescibacteria bacterium]|nr:RICIN domain-containing protein [Candidatus Latescibacterota bacterium]
VAFSNGGKAYWYRHYWASFMHAHSIATGNTRTASYNVDGDWYTPPFKGSTKEGEDAIWVTGWDKLFKLTYNPSSNSISRTDLPKDFKAEAGDVTYGVGVAKSDPNRLYVATRNGRFFHSRDGGQTWTETTYSGPKPTPGRTAWNMSSGLYIEVSDSVPDLVFWGGGTGSVACLVSRDGGKTFVSNVTGLPSGGEVRNVSVAPDGKMAFSSNFHVWIALDNRWYDMRSASMPSAALPAANALNYLPLQRKVRYFTWGAGVVDLDIAELNTADNPKLDLGAGSCIQIKSASSGRNLAATAGGVVVQASSNGAANQGWRIVPEDNFWRIENSATGGVLQVASASHKDAAAVQAAPWSGGDHQQWNVVRDGASYAIVARHSVKALQIAGTSTADSAKAEQGTYLAASNQKWTLVPGSNCGTTPTLRGAPVQRIRLGRAANGAFRIEGLEGDPAHVLAWDQNGRIVWRGEVGERTDLPRLGAGLYRVRVWSNHLDVTLTGTQLR